MLIVSFSLLFSCSKDSKAPEPPPKAEPVAEAAPEPDAKPMVQLPTTPEGWYAICEERVEGPSEAGECKTDAECMPTGCSKEMCVTKTVGAGVSTTCDIQPCFQVLDTCGCVSGQCSWSLKAALPKGLQGMVDTVNAAQ